MFYFRGGPQDYDDWEHLGNPGWSYHDVLPYFIKSEDNRNPEDIKLPYHGRGGELTVEHFPFQDLNIFTLLNAIRELGYETFDQNGKRQIGASLIQFTSRDGLRLSSNRAFIKPIRRKRRNLTVMMNSFATRILINRHTKKAEGVEFERHGILRHVYARKEVIVSCGSINSPKILMLSGIGPAHHLKEVGIPLIKNLGVGYNLHDHATIDGVVIGLTNKTSTLSSDQAIENDVYYFDETHRGPLSGTGPLQVNWFVQSNFEKGFDRPDIQYAFDAVNIQNFYTDPIQTYETNVLPLSYYDGIVIRPILLAPRSRGLVELNRTDPIFGDPFIHPNTYGADEDLLITLFGIREGLRLLSTKALNHIGARLVPIPLPACREYEFNSDDYWLCVITSYTTTIFHPVGTCKMGPKTDKFAVVDHELKVHGIRNLRVIDSSIMPKIMRGNTNAPTMMIAEKGSDMIKKKWLKGAYGNNEESFGHPDFENFFGGWEGFSNFGNF